MFPRLFSPLDRCSATCVWFWSGAVRSLPYGLPKGTTVRQEVGMAAVVGFFALADLLTPCGWLRPGHTGGSAHEARLCACSAEPFCAGHVSGTADALAAQKPEQDTACPYHDTLSHPQIKQKSHLGSGAVLCLLRTKCDDGAR